MTAAAKLPTCFASAAALPVADAPPAVFVAEAPLPVAVARPVDGAEPPVADVTIVVVQSQAELYTAVVYTNVPDEPVVRLLEAVEVGV